MSETMAAAFRDRLSALRIEDAETQALLALAWRPRPGPAVAELIRHCQVAFGAVTLR